VLFWDLKYYLYLKYILRLNVYIYILGYQIIFWILNAKNTKQYPRLRLQLIFITELGNF